MIRRTETPEPPRPVRGGSSFAERGFVLIAVLWFGLGVSAVASYLAVSARFQLRQATTQVEMAELDVSVMEAAAHWIVAALHADDPSVLGAGDGVLSIRRSFGGEPVTITVIPRETLVDLNIDDVGNMALAFAGRGLEDDDAAALAARIADFRDSDSLRSLNGAERADYAAAGLPGPRNDAFLTVDDIGLVLGVTPSQIEAIRPVLTVQDRPVGATAPTRVVVTGDRLDPVGGKQQIRHLDRAGLIVRITHAGGAVREFEIAR